MNLQMVALLVSVLFALAVIDFIRRNRLKERYALLWLAASVVMIVLSAWKGLLIGVTRTLRFEIPSNGLFSVMLLFLLVILFHFSIAISGESDRIKRLAQEIALLKERLQRLGGDAAPDTPTD